MYLGRRGDDGAGAGAEGVIEVATKKGRSGQFHVSYEAGIGFEAISKNIEMLSGNEFRNTARSLGIDIIDGGLSTNFRDAISRTGLVHIKKGGAVAKYNILPISLVYNHGFKPSELKMTEAILEDNEEIIEPRGQV